MKKFLFPLLLVLFALASCGDPNSGENGSDPVDTTVYRPGDIPTHPGPRADTIFEVGGIQFKMSLVEAGTFYMGASSAASSQHYDADAMANEGPVHAVSLSPYLLAECEVPQCLFLAVMGYNPSQTVDLFLPVQNVSMTTALRFIDSLRSWTGFDFRLPTEAEWEYAARGGRNAVNHRFSGSDTADLVGWFNDNSDNTIHIIRTKLPNALGFYDMSGNVMEWCSDWYGTYPSNPQSNPQGPEKPDLVANQKHAVRGGAFNDYPFFLRTTARQFQFASYEGPDVGFRLALSCR